MFALYVAGMSLRQVGKRFGVSGTTVKNVLRGAGYVLRTYEESMALYDAQGGGVPPGLAGSVASVSGSVSRDTSELGVAGPVVGPDGRAAARVRAKERARSMYERYLEGLSLAEVGREYGLTRERVRQIFKEAGTPTRSRAAARDVRRERRKKLEAPAVVDPRKVLTEVRLVIAVRHYEGSGRLVESADAAGVDPRALRRRLVRDGYPLAPTPRQRALLRHLADHRSRREIALLMELSRHDVVAEINAVLEKTRTADRRDAVRVARQFGWL